MSVALCFHHCNITILLQFKAQVKGDTFTQAVCWFNYVYKTLLLICILICKQNLPQPHCSLATCGLCRAANCWVIAFDEGERFLIWWVSCESSEGFLGFLLGGQLWRHILVAQSILPHATQNSVFFANIEYRVLADVLLKNFVAAAVFSVSYFSMLLKNFC